MTTLATAEVAESTTAQGFWTRSRKAGTVYLALGLFAAGVFGWLTPAGLAASFRIAVGSGFISIPVPGKIGAIVFGLLCAAVGVALLAGYGRRHFGLTTGIAVATFLMAFLCWQLARDGGKFMSLDEGLRQTLFYALPLMIGATSGVLCERAGVINVSIEGQFLAGAFAGALIGTMAGSAWAGLMGAALAGLLMGALLAMLAIRYLVDQVVLGVILNVLALGLTGFLYERFMQTAQDKYNKPPQFAEWKIPLLSDIPLIGPALFGGKVFVYIGLGVIGLVYVGLFHTRWGLRVRAVGEHPTAADTVGIRVNRVRYRNVLLGGIVAGIGGAFFTLASTPQFTKDMIAGKGFIALAAMIFGRWSPVGAMFAALLFGFAEQLKEFLSIIGSPIPSEFLAMAPYLATILAVAGLVGKVRAPAADGKPYIKS